MTNNTLHKIEKAAIVLIVIMAVSAGAAFGFITSEIKNFSGINNLKKFQPSIPTRLYDVNGELIAELFQQKRDLIAYEDLPQSLINAFLAAEDKSFYEHFGINPMAIARAMGKNVIASFKRGKPVIIQGGSTITQQLAKRLFTKSQKTVGRKALEAILAFQIEKKFTKNEILEMYFNQIYLGHGCHGIATAAKFFFNRDVKNLKVAESSILAALPSKPNGYSPLKFPKLAFEKHKDTLTRMVDAEFLTRKRADKLFEEFWPGFIESLKTEYPTKTAVTKTIDKAPYFTDYVRQILLSRFGKEVVYSEGLSVYTTLNLKRQRIGQNILIEHLKEQNIKSARANAYYNKAVDRGLIGSYYTLRMLFSLPRVVIKNTIETKFKKKMVDSYLDAIDVLSILVDAPSTNHSIEKFRTLVSGISSSLKVEGAMIAIEPKTGYISTMIGGSEYNVGNQYNRAVQARRQPGSSFKPFVYGSGIASKRINPGTALPDAPIIDIDARGDTWAPGNYGGKFSGLVRVRKALEKSVNIIAVRIYDLVGPDKVISFAAKMLKVPEVRFTPGPSLALGTAEMTPFEMATGYAIYANRGKDVIPFSIRYVIDRDGNELANIEEEVGNIIAAKELNGTIQVISPEVAYVMTSMMQSVLDWGTPRASIRIESKFRQKAAVKTGTTQNWTDAWLCGYTSDIATVVWVGYDKPFMSLGKYMAGSSVAGPIWGDFMREIYNGMKKPVVYKKPKGVYTGGVCKYSGLIPGPNCKERIGEIMISGSGPRSVCDGNHYKMKTVLDRYMEKEGLKEEE